MARFAISKVEFFTSPTNADKKYFRPRLATHANGRPWWAHYRTNPPVAGDWCFVTIGEGIDAAADLDVDVLTLPEKARLDEELNPVAVTRVNTKLTAFGLTTRASVGQTVRQVVRALMSECRPTLTDENAELTPVEAIALRKGMET